MKKTEVKWKNDFNFKFGELFERMTYLLKLSSELYPTYPNSLSKMYIKMMRDIGKRNALRIHSKIEKLICKNCNNLLFLDTRTEFGLKSNLCNIIM
jgi:RNase P subunit RPR2